MSSLSRKEYQKKYHANPVYKARRREQLQDPVRKAKRKNYRLKRIHGITHEDYLTMLKKQQYKCLICKQDHSIFKDGLVVDHCHATGKIRGLLCPFCNTGIGLLKENPTILRRAIHYLK